LLFRSTNKLTRISFNSMLFTYLRRKTMTTCSYANKSKNLLYVQSPSDNKPAKRLCRKDSENAAPSLGDPVFEKARQQPATPQQIARLKNNRRLIRKSEEMIELHVNKRIALFFQQLVVCYRVPFHFEIGDTIQQGASSKTLIKKVGNSSVRVLFNSAHSSTLPCLTAYPRSEWRKWKRTPQNHDKPRGFVYLHGSHYDNCQNATLSLIKLVNTADSTLDGTKKDLDKLRSKSITLLNKAARGRTTPKKALHEYLNIAKSVIKKITGNPKTSEETRTILNIYLREVQGSSEEFRQGILCDRLLDLKIDDCTENKDSLRKMVYQHRYKIIRESQETESVIRRKITVLSAKILGIKRRPQNFLNVFNAKIFSLTSTDYERKTLAKLFNISEEQLKCDLAGKRKAAAEKLVNDKKFKKLFNILMRDIRNECHSLVNKEFIFRSSVSRSLRHHKGWRQIDLAQEYEEAFRLSISQPTISRIENSHKPIDRELVLRLSELFEVDSGLFLPALFTSTDES
jgi:hypothetical protein